jgi:hypothetical protein
VEAPVAAAQRLLTVGVSVPVGAVLLMCDLGAGFEATVLRRTPHGFDILSTLDDPEAGGARVDDLLTDTLVGPAPHGLEPPSARWAAVAAIRQATESLERAPAITVPLPPPLPAAVLVPATVHTAAAPVLARAAEVAAATVAAADVRPDQLAGVYCHGAAAALPGVADAIGQRLGVPVQVLTEPGITAVLGAGDAAPAPAGQVPEPPAAAPPLRRLLTLALPGVASLALFAQAWWLAHWNTGSRVWHPPLAYLVIDWGELAMAAVFAVTACLVVAPFFAVVLARARPGPDAPGTRAAIGLLGAAAAGLSVAGLYAVFTAGSLGTPVAGPLRWTLLPALPIAAVAAGIAAVAAYRGRQPRQGWEMFLAFPTSSVLAGTAGMLFIGYAVQARVRPQYLVGFRAGLRTAGLLLGVACACAIARSGLWRLILAAPLGIVCAAIVDGTTTGVLATLYTIAAACWWIRRLADLARPPATAPTGTVLARIKSAQTVGPAQDVERR